MKKSLFLFILSCCSIFLNAATLTNGTEISLITDVIYPGYAIATGDITGTGKVDLVSRISGTTYFGVWTDLAGTINYIDHTSLDEPANDYYALALCDLDEDGDLDLVTAGPNGTSYSPNFVYNWNSTDSIFNYAGSIYTFGSVALYGRGVVTGDFNNDSKDDVVWLGSKDIVVGINSTTVADNITFSSITKYSDVLPGNNNMGNVNIRTGDFNNDGNLDIINAFSSPYNGAYSLLLGNGDGTFDITTVYTDEEDDDRALSLDVTDINNDGYDDFVLLRSNFTSGSYSATVELYTRNNANDGFDITTIYTDDNYGREVMFGDVDSDGDLDILFRSDGGYYCTIFLNDGNGSFSTSPDLSIYMGRTSYMQFLDVDNDGYGEVVHFYSSDVSYYDIGYKPDTPTANDSTKTYDGNAHTASATAAEGASIAWYTTSTGSTVTTAPTGTDNGTYSAYAAAIDDASGMESDDRVLVNLTINKASLTVVDATVVDKAYDGTTDASISGATLSGVVEGETVSLDDATSGTFASAGVGTGISVSTAMTISGEAATNYTLTQPTLTANITAKELTVTDAAVADKAYDGTTDATISGATLSGVVEGETVSLDDATTGTFASASVGTGISASTAMTISGEAATNYTLTQPTLTANITAKELTVTDATVADKAYDGTTDATISGATLSGVIDGETVSLDDATSGTFASASVGTGISVSTAMAISGETTANYTLTQPTLTANISAKELTVTDAAVADKAYDGTTDATISGATLSGVVEGETVSLDDATSGTFASASVGTGISVSTAMAISGETAANYTLTQPTLSANVTAKELTITDATVADKVYDGTTDASISGATLSGVIDGETVSLDDATSGTFASASIGTGISVSTAMTISGEAAANYTLTQPTLTANITAKELTVTDATVADKAYDGTTDATISGATLSGVIDGETVSLDDATSGTFASASVGTGISVSTAMAISGEAAANYTLAQPTLTADITAATLEITAEAQSKNEGESDPDLTYSITDGAIVEGDELTGSLERETGETAGTYEIQQGSLTAGDNYSITFVSANFVINTVTGIEELSKTNIAVYPNPVTTTLKIKTNNVINSVSVINITGQKIFEQDYHQSEVEIDFAQFNNGIYIIHIKTNTGKYLERVIK